MRGLKVASQVDRSLRWRAPDQRGQGLAEYIIIVVIVAILIILGIRYFGSSVTDQFGNATDTVDSLAGDEAPVVGGGGKSAKDTTRADRFDRSYTEKSLRGGGGKSRGGGGGSGGDIGGDGGGGSGADFAKLRSSGVGGDKSKSFEDMALDSGAMWSILGLFCIFGFFFAMRMTKDKSAGKKKKKKKKKKKEM